MLDAPLTHSATLRRLLYEALAELGLDPTDIYRRAYQGMALSPPLLESREEHDNAPQLWQALAGLTGDPDIGLHLGEVMKPRLLDVVGYLLLASRDLRQGLESFVRFQHILSGGFAARLEEQGETARVIIDLNYRGFDSLRQQMECLALLMCKLLRLLSDDEFRLLGVDFRHAAPRRLGEHRRLLGLTPRFGQPHDALIFPATLLARPSRTANPGLFALLHRHAEEQLLALHGNQLLNRLRYLLDRRLGQDPTDLHTCAAELGLDGGPLQRRLAAQGSSFRAVLEGVRRERAQALLGEGLAIREVARACGFAELSPFYRAFRRWYGQTPEAYRRLQQG